MASRSPALPALLAALLAAACAPLTAAQQVCGSDGLTYPSPSALERASVPSQGLVAVHRGRCLTTAGDAPPLGPSLEEFGKCQSRCQTKYKTCTDGQGTESMEPCFYEFTLACVCTCRKHLLAAPAPAVHGPGIVTGSSSAARDGMFSDDYLKAFDCEASARGEMVACVGPCEPAKDEQCAMACVQPFIDKICHCDARGNTSTTAAPPTIPPTNPPTVPPTRPTAPPPEPTAHSGSASTPLAGRAAVALAGLAAWALARG